MRTLPVLAGLAATATVLAAGPAAAQQWGQPVPVPQECQQRVNDNRLAGAAVGAGLGAVVGSNVAGRGNRTEGAVLGAVLGAAVGQQVGRGRIACDDPVYNQGYNPGYNQGRPVPQQPPQQSWNNGYGHPNYGYNDGYSQPTYNGGYQQPYGHPGYTYQTSYVPPRQVRGQCGWGEARYTTPDNRVSSEAVWMCRGRRGEWVIQQR